MMLIAATLISRVGGDARTGALFGVVALAYGAAGGLLLLAGERGITDLAAPDLLLAATVLLVLAAAATIAVGDYSQVFLAAMVVSIALGVGAGISLAFDTGPTAPAVVVGTVLFGFFPILPMLSYRAAQLPMPAIPTGPDDLRADSESVNGTRVLALSDRADDVHTGLIMAFSVLILGSIVVILLDGGGGGWILATVLALLLMLRARPYRTWTGRTPVLMAGSLALGAVAAAGFVVGDLLTRLGLIVGGLLAAAAISLVYGLGVTGRRVSPLWGRLLDISEILLIVAVVPLAAWVAGWYGWISTIKGR
jgi:type VII secretion integral membrane protein EccD